MPRKKRKPTDEHTVGSDSTSKPLGTLSNEEGKSNRHALPVLDDEPADWCAAVLTTLVRVHSRMERRMVEVVGAHGMTLAQFDVLATLWTGEGITQQELAERLLVTKGNVVGLIDRVCRAKWVERRADPSDRRANRLYLTDQGRKRLSEVRPRVASHRTNLFGIFTGDELRQLYQFLRRLEDSVEK